MGVVEILKSISMVAGYVITISTCLLIFVRPIRDKVINVIRKSQEDEEFKHTMLEMNDNLTKHINDGDLQREALLALLRNNITKMYYNYILLNEVPKYERENFVKQCNIYFSLDGNCYVKAIYNEFLKIPVKMEHK